MIPQGASLLPDTVPVAMPSRTYKLNVQQGRMDGMTDGLGAVKQAVYKILHTERFAHLIYTGDYGFEREGLIGASPGLIRSELQRRIREALLQDDRISEVADFAIGVQGDEADISFTVNSVYGDFRMEVNANV
ncbi:DUF2634 domain-containing protein [Paenibacillus phocaensis]|uniref:DUF2634 domain-containing protein n=1 Tax=Paenibacillus phocaensis TaxID=1776378 RepID=UPI0003AA9184|nr:DUF2634 domain-containing protein [Paenibacillus phocaensis]